MTRTTTITILLVAATCGALALYWIRQDEKRNNPEKQTKDVELTLNDASEALLRSIVSRESKLGKRLAARDLICDHKLGICSTAGLDMNLKQRTFRLHRANGGPDSKMAPWFEGEFYFADDGTLMARILSDH